LANAPKEYARRLLFSLLLCTHSVSNDSIQTFHDLGIARKADVGLGSAAAWVKRPSSRRGVRAGKSAKRNRAGKRFVPFALINARSLSKQANVISHYIISNKLDLLAVTETWLTMDTGDCDLLDFCPAGYRAVHLPRPNRRGGGVDLVFRDSFLVDVLPSGITTPSFENLMVLLRFNSVCVRLVIVYRPPSQSTKCSEGIFLSEFSDFLQSLALSAGKLLLVGDFNIEKATNSTSTKLLSLLDSHGLTQHVKGLTHIGGCYSLLTWPPEGPELSSAPLLAAVLLSVV
jgi:hypothetical protein